MSKIASKSAVKRAIRSSSAGRPHLPEWNLDDLYRGLEDPAIKRDLDRIDGECAAFEDACRGKLAGFAAAANAAL
jgi:oligoendopeptidase F